MLERRPAVSEDEPFLRELYASTRPDLASWDPAERELFLDVQLRARTLEWGARFADSTDELILLDGLPVGRAWVAWGPDACVIVDLALLPGFHRRGLGTEVVEAILDEADGRAVPVRATSERRNAASLAFFAGLGFATVAEDEVYVALERPVSRAPRPRASG